MSTTEDSRRVALEGALYWSDAVALQDARIREVQEWILAESADGRRVIGVDDESRKVFHRLRADRHFLVVAALNCSRALDLLAKCGAAIKPLTQHIRILRNCLEHWDEADGPSLQKFRAMFPHGDPSSHRWGGPGTFIGELDVDALIDDVRALREQLLEMEHVGWSWKG